MIIFVYNDAKRTTLSGWSFPFRIVTAEFARNFKLRQEKISVSDIDMRYVTPSSHAELLSCIVESDAINITKMLSESLAISRRLDGSVDRTQKHNVYVMAQVITKDGLIETICLGFDVHKAKGATGYLICVKRSHKNVFVVERLSGIIFIASYRRRKLKYGPLKWTCC